MGAVTFVFAAGLLVGIVGVRAGIPLAAAAIVVGASAAVLLDAANRAWRQGLQERAMTRSRTPFSTAATVRPSRDLDDVAWLTPRDTFKVSLVAIAVVGGLTYATLVTLAAAVAHLVGG
jgi:hypothetical protein